MPTSNTIQVIRSKFHWEDHCSTQLDRLWVHNTPNQKQYTLFDSRRVLKGV